MAGNLLDLSAAWLASNYHVAICQGGDAAQLIEVNPNTLRTRVAREQALAMRDDDDGRHVRFTGFHLVHNLIQDRLSRYSVPVDQADLLTWTLWVHDHVLTGERFNNAVIRAWSRTDATATSFHLFEEGDVEPFTGDAALILPIGSMTLRLAVTLFMRQKGAAEAVIG